MLKWTVSLPRVVAEDDRTSVTIEASTIEDAISSACRSLHGPGQSKPIVGQVYLVSARVEVMKRPTLPLRSV